MHALQKPQQRAAAFTLLETIAVLILIGVLSAVALPLFFYSSSFNARTTRDELIISLRYAQQLAMADASRVVQFITTTSSFSIVINGTPIALADGSGNYPRSIDSNLTLSPATTLSYSPLGDTSATTFTLTGNEKACVATTGFAYAC